MSRPILPLVIFALASLAATPLAAQSGSGDQGLPKPPIQTEQSKGASTGGTLASPVEGSNANGNGGVLSGTEGSRSGPVGQGVEGAGAPQSTGVLGKP